MILFNYQFIFVLLIGNFFLNYYVDRILNAFTKYLNGEFCCNMQQKQVFSSLLVRFILC